MFANHQRGVWRLALGLAVIAVLMLSGGPWSAESSAGCACPCESDTPASDAASVKRHSCCADPQGDALNGVAATLVDVDAATLDLRPRSAARHRVPAPDAAPMPAPRGPPVRLRYLENRTLLL
ncbi:MAG: hypothetical protein AAGA54_29820 [Myxococcota bacterium]